jgi:hypothetical protein
MAGKHIDIKSLKSEWPAGSFDENGLITGTGARALHEELCRQSGMTADEIIEDWNEKSDPDDQW